MKTTSPSAHLVLLAAGHDDCVHSLISTPSLRARCRGRRPGATLGPIQSGSISIAGRGGLVNGFSGKNRGKGEKIRRGTGGFPRRDSAAPAGADAEEGVEGEGGLGGELGRVAGAGEEAIAEGHAAAARRAAVDPLGGGGDAVYRNGKRGGLGGGVVVGDHIVRHAAGDDAGLPGQPEAGDAPGLQPEVPVVGLLLPGKTKEGDAAAGIVLVEEKVFVLLRMGLVLVEGLEVHVQREGAGEDFLPDLVVTMVIAAELVVQAVEEGLPDTAKEQDIVDNSQYNTCLDAAALPLALQLRQVLRGVRAVDEGGDLRVQGLGDALQGVQVRLGLAPLPGGDRLAGDVKLLRQLLLGELFRHAETGGCACRRTPWGRLPSLEWVQLIIKRPVLSRNSPLRG